MEIQMLVLPSEMLNARDFEKYFWISARNSIPLPEALSDIFKVEVREVTDSKSGLKVNRAFVTFV